MEISASEIKLLCKTISSSVSEYSLSGVYSIQRGMLLRLHHSTQAEKFVAVSSFAAWITTKNLSLPEASRFVQRARELLERKRLLSVNQVGGERIVRFSFQGRSDINEVYNLYAEFFGRGNQIITRARANEEDEIILDLSEPQQFRHRTLFAGEKYLLPPARGAPLDAISVEYLLEKLREELSVGKRNDRVDAIRWFGRNVSTSRKFVEEIFFRAAIPRDSGLEKLDQDSLTQLSEACKQLLADLEKSRAGYLLLPEISAYGKKPQHDNEALSNSGSSLEVDVCPIVPSFWQQSAAKGVVLVKEFPSLGEALDEAQVQSLVVDRRMKASFALRAKSAELQSAISKQESLMRQNDEVATELRRLGRAIMNGSVSELTKDLVDALVKLGVLEFEVESGGKLRFVNEPRSFLNDTKTVHGLASRLFDEAKRLEDSNQRIEGVRRELAQQLAELEAQSLQQEDRAQRKLVTERREREWFERYRWFLTSDGRLVIGGRDATSNSVIINKYLEERDLVFHADLHGSPFFILKNRESPEKELGEGIAREVAQATVSFSRAWKDELGSADSYWIHPIQVKKSAPSGEYLPRGSFFIEGKKNYVKHLKVELAVGLMTTDKLPREEKESVAPSSKRENVLLDAPTEGASPEVAHTVRKKSVLVVCGAEKAISAYCFSTVKIAPGKERASNIAKRMKQLIIVKVKDPELKEQSKKIELDELIRVLPSGSYKIVAEKQNN